ncbi:MAG: oligosaccharide flippase family protein [Chitinispirillia bacterium]|nr:oligosaccharide flippase family protein [Chitinispirillia bacterium]MCL2241912.1 oligosaccharide flippase family protein [Chitinispirillia bacterium]
MKSDDNKQPAYSVASRSARGGALLIIRQVSVQAMNFAGIIFLARYLTIAEYGFFGIVFFLFTFISNFGDVGFSASLLRQPEEPEKKDYSAVFTAQLVLVAVVGGVFALLSPSLCKIYSLPASYAAYFLLIALSLVITTFRAVPTVRLERHLDFKWLSVIEVIQAAAYNGLAAWMAYRGYGPLSFSLALLCRVLLGSILVNIVSRGTLSLCFDMARIKKHLAFGLPYQAGIFVNVLKDSISPVVIGLFLGAAVTGMVNMASTIAAFPVMLFLILNRVFFPAFSRSINDKPALEKLFGVSVRLSNACVAPLAIYILLMVEPFTLHVFGAKWVGETTNYSYLLWSANLFLPTMAVCACLLNAFGRSKTVLKFNLLWMAVTLGIGTPLIFAFGAKGFGYANILVNVMTVSVVLAVRKYIGTRVFREQIFGWIPAVALAGIPIAFRHFFDDILGWLSAGPLDLSPNLAGIAVVAATVCCYYALSSALTYFICRKDIGALMAASRSKQETP